MRAIFLLLVSACCSFGQHVYMHITGGCTLGPISAGYDGGVCLGTYTPGGGPPGYGDAYWGYSCSPTTHFEIHAVVNGSATVLYSGTTGEALSLFGSTGTALDLCNGYTAPTNNCTTVTVKNNSSVGYNFQAVDSHGNPYETPASANYASFAYLAPGATATLRFAAPVTDDMAHIGVQRMRPADSSLNVDGVNGAYMEPEGAPAAMLPSSDFTVAYNPCNAGSHPTSLPNAPAAGSTGAGSEDHAPNTYTNGGDNGPISFGNTNQSDILKTGFQALYNQIGTGNAALDADLHGIQGELTTIDKDIQKVDADAVSGFNGVSNRLSNIATNRSDGDQSWTNLDSKFHDATAATAAGNSAQSAAIGNVSSMLAAVPAAPSISSGEPLSATVHTYVAGVPNFVVTPSASIHFGALWAVIRTVWVWILYAAYAGKVIDDLYRVVDFLWKNRGVQIQPLDAHLAGFGGNAAGALLVPLITIAIMAVWAVALATSMSALFGQISWSTLMGAFFGDPLTGADSGAVGMLWAVFPVAQAFALVLAYLTFKITSFKAVIIAGAAAKFLVGS